MCMRRILIKGGAKIGVDSTSANFLSYIKVPRGNSAVIQKLYIVFFIKS